MHYELKFSKLKGAMTSHQPLLTLSLISTASQFQSCKIVKEQTTNKKTQVYTKFGINN